MTLKTASITIVSPSKTPSRLRIETCTRTSVFVKRKCGRNCRSCHGENGEGEDSGKKAATGEEASSSRVLAGTAPIAQTQCATAAGVKGATPCRRRRFHEEPWSTTGDRFGEPSVEDSPLASAIPAGW